MLAQIGVNRFNFIYSNLGTTPASAGPGTSVIPGASNGEGSWTQIASGANIAQDIYLLVLWVAGGSSVGQIKDHLLDIGVDPAGASSYAAIVENIVCGESGSSSGTVGITILLPLFIKAGSSVAVRVQGSNATAGTVRVVATFFGQPSHPELVRVGQYAETIGAITNSAGVSFTPGNSGAEGSWVSLGTLARACWWFQLGIQCSNDTMTNLTYHFDLAYGDGSNKHLIIQDLRIFVNTSEAVSWAGALTWVNAFAELAAGAELFIRGTCSGTAETGWNAVAIGVGG